MLNNKKVKVLKRAMYKELNTLSKKDLINMIIQSDINIKSMINDHIKTVEKYDSDLNQLADNYFELLAKLIKEEEKHSKASHHINNLLKFIRTLKEDIKELKINNSDLKSQVRHLKEELEQSKQSKSYLINEIEEQNTIIEIKEEEIKTLIKINVRESNKIEELEEDKIELRQYIQQLEKEIDTDNDIIKELIDKRYGLNIEIQEKEEEIKELKEEIKELNKSCNNLFSDFMEEFNKVKELENKIIDLESEEFIALSEEEEDIVLEYDEEHELYM